MFYFRYDVDFGYYREPGNDGYAIDDPSMQKYFHACVDDSGQPQECRLQVGDQYIQCAGNDTHNCQILEPCPSQPDCTSTNGANSTNACKTIWCRQYTIETVTDQDTINSSTTLTNLGYVPCADYCYTVTGTFSQELGAILNPGGSLAKLGNCYYADGSTLVQRHLSGSFAYCGGEVCNTTYSGAYDSYAYDPRYRPWYTETKAKQAPNWSPPYLYGPYGLFYITFSHPIYETLDDGREVFAGVLAIDYRCTYQAES